jgi:hypothetical protein
MRFSSRTPQNDGDGHRGEKDQIQSKQKAYFSLHFQDLESISGAFRPLVRRALLLLKAPVAVVVSRVVVVAATGVEVRVAPLASVRLIEAASVLETLILLRIPELSAPGLELLVPGVPVVSVEQTKMKILFLYKIDQPFVSKDFFFFFFYLPRT